MRWSESLKAYELMAIFRYELDAKKWESGMSLPKYASAHPTEPELRDSQWARKLLGYKGKTSSAFWQFVRSAEVPHIRLNHRKIMFSEQAVFDWLERRSVGRIRPLTDSEYAASEHGLTAADIVAADKRMRRSSDAARKSGRVRTVSKVDSLRE